MTQRPRFTPASLASLLLAAALTGCASAPPPDVPLALSQSAVDRAAGSAATDAPEELASARDKLARARLAYAAKNYTEAHQLAEQAEADAGLAEARARSVRADRALAEVRAGVRQIRQEGQRP